jgi:hypothetical protein
MAACKSCNADIRWATSSKTETPIPIDREPVSDGNLVLEFKHGESVARPATDDDRRLKRDLFKSHFATCPQAGQWRNKERQ